MCIFYLGKSEKAVYLMCKNFAQKVEWVNRLEEVRTVLINWSNARNV